MLEGAGGGGYGRTQVAIDELVARGDAELSLEGIESVFPFSLDPFQKEAVRDILDNKSVVVRRDASVLPPPPAGPVASGTAVSAFKKSRRLSRCGRLHLAPTGDVQTHALSKWSQGGT